ncbi:MAG: hypothetical protein Q7T56_07825 [Nocardioidaceae bacterium]|nr:hypothetical protein [Nocardioidaceae bacterium]
MRQVSRRPATVTAGPSRRTVLENMQSSAPTSPTPRPKLPAHGIDDPGFLQPVRPMSAIGG